MSQEDSRHHTKRDRLCYHDIKKYLHLQEEVNYRIQQWSLRYFNHVMRMNDSRYPKISTAWRSALDKAKRKV